MSWLRASRCRAYELSVTWQIPVGPRNTAYGRARRCGGARGVRHGRQHADHGVARDPCLGLAAMIQIPAGARVALAMQPVDFRKGAHSLAALAAEVLAEDPFSGAVIVFRAKRGQQATFRI